MKKIKPFTLLLAGILALALSTGCSAGAAADKAAKNTAAGTTAAAALTDAPSDQTTLETTEGSMSVNVTDMAGREIVLDKPAEKVVALTASDCEILYAIGAGDKLVGRGEYCDYPAEVASLPFVESGAETNIEQIIALDPDVVIMNTMAQTKEQVAALENAGITVVANNAVTIDDVYTSITLLGAITGKDSEAASVITDMKSVFDNIDQSSENTGKTVYFEVSPLEYGLWTAGKGTFMDEIAGLLGLTNIFADVDGWGEVSQEQVIERNPDYIVTIAMYSGEGTSPVDEIAGREGWQNISAVKNGMIYNADSNEISRPGPRIANAAKAFYDFVEAAV